MTTVRVDDPDDPRLDDYRRLNEQAYRRRHEGDRIFVAEGYLAIDRVIDSGHRLRSVLLQPSRVERFAHHLRALHEVPVLVADAEVIAAVVGFDLHRGVVAIAERRPLHPVAGIAATARRVAVLEGLNDPENVGVIARSARALGIDALVLDPTCTDPYARRTVRVSLGEVLHLPVARAERWPDDLDRLTAAGFETWAMTPIGDDDVWTLAPPDRLAILLGAEGPGLTPATLARATRRVAIPIAEEVDSLNVGHAAAIAFAATGRPRPPDRAGQPHPPDAARTHPPDDPSRRHPPDRP